MARRRMIPYKALPHKAALPPTSWQFLHTSIIHNIMLYLDARESFMVVPLVCRHWRRSQRDEGVWMRYYKQWVCSNPSELEGTTWMHRYINAIGRNESFASLCIPKSMGYVMSFYGAMRDGNDRLALFNMKRFPMQPRDVPPYEGFSALEWAATLDLHEVIRALIRAGCDPNQMMPCEMPLIVFLSSLNKERAVTVLLEMGANVNATACDGNTALHKCAETGNIALARIIINHGGDVCLRNHRGFTPLHCAVFSNHYDVMRLMLAARDGGPSFLCSGDFSHTKQRNPLPMVRTIPEKLKC